MTERGKQKALFPFAEEYGAFAGQSQVGQMLGHGDQTPAELLDFLQSKQGEQRLILPSDIFDAAKHFRISTAEACGVASFYSMLEVINDSDTDDKSSSTRQIVRVCDGPSCCLRGALQLKQRVCEIADERDDTFVTRTSCLGKCDVAPALMLDNDAFGPMECVKLHCIDDLKSLLRSRQQPFWLDREGNRGEKVSGDMAELPLSGRIPARSSRRNNGEPTSLAYESLKKVLEDLPAKIVDEIERADLRGRGGAGFNTGRKWRMVTESESKRRFVVCNADESEPGTFKDLALMEGDPHLLLEGMAICAYSIGAGQGIIYLRGEYSRAAELLDTAIRQAQDAGLLGANICGTDFAFNVQLHCGAGAYICGEETALLESLEGKRGEPRARPPYPTENGYLGCPTVVNNVETLCAVPFIVDRGAKAYRELGRGNASGTKLFCLSGHVEKPGVYEAPLGITTRELLEEYAGGMRAGGKFKLAVTGGAAGTFISEEMLEIPLSYDSWNAGIAVGSGAIIVADDSVNAVTMLLWILQFFEAESCGKCTPCRIGTKQARQIVERIASSQGQGGDIERLLQLGKTLERTSFCGLGQSAAWPIESAIQYFRADFEVLGAK